MICGYFVSAVPPGRLRRLPSVVLSPAQGVHHRPSSSTTILRNQCAAQDHWGEQQGVQRLGSGRHAELIGGRVARLAARGGEDCGADGVEPLGNDSVEVRGQSKPTFVGREVETLGLAVCVVGHADEVEARGMHHSTVMADAEVTNGRQRNDGERPGP